MPSDLASILRLAESAAEAGGHVLHRYWNDGVELRNKSDVGGKSYDLVSDADLESQSVIANLIANICPDHELMGEEDLVGDTEAEHLWVIDPLDGTNNFLHHVPHFAVSIAYYHNGTPTVGVVLNPITGDTYTAVKGDGAKHNGAPVRTATATELSTALVGCGFYYDRGAMMRSTLSAIEDFFAHDIHGIRRFGTAALDLCAVASGMFGAFFEYKLSPWDFAAGQLIVTEAGGKISDAKGNPLGLEPSSVLASCPGLYEAALEITAKHHPA
ncbi:inositol monophosphatase family protein [Rhodopirellula sp. JC639]|uniref:inositol monophosphatase family protein n=1 Tax=Stieleria mannarensis TaxID=2755585 RepID=UPI0016002B51|nr:inositol monophosphatase family protein [Rhodopirellula sp. JC639]